MPGSHFTASERVKLETFRHFNLSQAQIARHLGRSPSTISRELARNAGPSGRYVAGNAQEKYEQRREACRPERKLADPDLCVYVEEKLREQWSPEQIAGRLRLECPQGARVSHETIYQHVYTDKRHGGVLYTNLRQGHKKRQKRSNSRDRRGIIKDRVLIHERPAVVERQARLGDWEGDTVIGKNHQGAIATFVDRKSLYTLASLMPDKSAEELNKAAIRVFSGVRSGARNTLTLDNGKEFSRFKDIERAVGIAIYFAEPYRSCQRAINENTNGLLRQFLPKKTDFSTISQSQLHAIVEKLNNRPRKKLHYKTPREVFILRGVALSL